MCLMYSVIYILWNIYVVVFHYCVVVSNILYEYLAVVIQETLLVLRLIGI